MRLADALDEIPGLSPEVRAYLRQLNEVFPHREGEAMGWQNDQDDQIQTEPILAKKDCEVQIDAAEKVSWKVKEASKGGAPGYEGQEFDAMKLTVTITDPNVQTEHEGARPRLTIEHQFNLAKYPYWDKKNAKVAFMNRANLYDLEEAFGFDPIFTNGDGQPVEPYITKNGRKMAPKKEGVKRQPNPEFMSAFFNPDGSPNLEWAGKKVLADIEVEKSEQYGDKNVIKRFKKLVATV